MSLVTTARRSSRVLPLALAAPLLWPALASPALASNQVDAVPAPAPAAPAAAAAPATVPPVQPRLALLPAAPAARSLNLPFAITPERRALLNTIRFAEGTWANGQELGYRVMFGGGLMSSLDRHPDRVVRSSGYASAAAGAYQFMPFTWSMASQALGLRGFGPDVQDQAALYLIQRRGALQLADRGELTPQLVARLAPEWASFPTLRGSSYYGQPVKRLSTLKRFYEQSLQALRNQSVVPIEPAAAPELMPQPAVAPAELADLCTDSSLDCQIERLQKLGINQPAPPALSPSGNS